jgi:uncharacterized protein YecT (DUF1311 family)
MANRDVRKKMVIPALLHFALVVLLGVPVNATQDDETNCCCTTAETSVCISKILRKIDMDLNETYQRSLKKAALFSRQDEENLKNVERKWVAYKDEACKAESGLSQGGSILPNIYGLCVIKLTKRRIADLKSAYTDAH